MIPMKIRERAMAREILTMVKETSNIDERLFLLLAGIPIREKFSTEIYLKKLVEKASIEQQGRKRSQVQQSCVNEQ